MKKIVISIVVLLTAIFGMAYLYFSRLNSNQNTPDIGLYAAASNSGFIFSFQNDRSITDILKEQQLFEELLGTAKYKQLSILKKHLLTLPAISQAIDQQNIYISFVAGADQKIDFLCSTQINSPENNQQVFRSIKASGIRMDSPQELTKLTMPDSSIFYLGLKENLALLSNSRAQVAAALTKDLSKKDDKFINYIQAGNRFTKNSLAQLYVNFNKIPSLLKNIVAGGLNGQLTVLNQQNAFASLTYNYSNEKILLTGTTLVNDPKSYYQLFSSLQPQKITINNLLPAHTASYTIFAVDSYGPWRLQLNNWFRAVQQDVKVNKRITDINTRYHLNLEDIFPRYFKNQLITFQLSTSEKIGAIHLSNGDKVMQLLLDLSSDYNDEIKIFKEPDLLYAYFGQPFSVFKRPYYTIIDNYLVCANNASTLTVFLNSYNNNQLLIDDPGYINASNQLPVNANVIFYIGQQNSTGIFRKNIYLPYYKHITDSQGLKKYDSFTYQLSGDKGKFQTNILINKQPDILQKDSLAL